MKIAQVLYIINWKITQKLKKKQVIISLIVGSLFLLKLCVGIYCDDEFPEKHLFMKHRPIWQTYFYSPRGMSDWKISEMPIEKQKEQLLFDEFILNILPEENKYW